MEVDTQGRDGEIVILVASYGVGIDSTAMLVEFEKRGIIPDLILFADTGAERSETYQYLEYFNKWLLSHNMPIVEIVKYVDKNGEVMTLERNCLEQKTLPSLAFGFKTCSQKFKSAPQEKFCNHYKPCIKTWAKGRKVIKAIGFDADEERRAKKYSDKKYVSWYPMVEWNYGRSDCERIITEAGLLIPGKSSCFFCPSMKKHEIFELKKNNPDLLKRALKIEANAKATLKIIPGLGRSYAWKDLISAEESQIKMFCDVVDQTCGCYDG